MVEKRKVLVTGGAGYIGSHACKELARQGYEPVCFDNLSLGYEKAVKWGCLVKGSLLDTDLLIQTLKTHKISSVMHFAALSQVGESFRDPEKYYINNVQGTLSLLHAMLSLGIKEIVFSSTCATYGIPINGVLVETSAQNPINPYGWTKLMIEQILKDYSKAYGIKPVALRYFNAAGADAEGEIGESHNPETHLIPVALMRTRTEDSPLAIFGNDYETPDGTCIRDYIHVTDLALAHVQALEFVRNTGQFEAFNLGTGNGYSVMEIVTAIRNITGKKLEILFQERRAGDPARLVAQAEKAKTLLGWEPRFSSLENIIKTALYWMENRMF